MGAGESPVGRTDPDSSVVAGRTPDDANLLFDLAAERRSCRVVHVGFRREAYISARRRDAVSELCVATRDQAVVEPTDILEYFATNRDTAAPAEVPVFGVLFDREARVFVIPSYPGVLTVWDVDLHVVGEVVIFLNFGLDRVEPIRLNRMSASTNTRTPPVARSVPVFRAAYELWILSSTTAWTRSCPAACDCAT